MKRGFLLLVMAACGFAAWQRWTLIGLREEEAQTAAARAASTLPLAGRDELPSDGGENRSKDRIDDSELPVILGTLRAMEPGYARAKVFDHEIESFRRNQPELLPKLARLTPRQAVSLFAEWMGDEKDSRSHHSHVVTRTALIMGQVNPAAALEIAAERRNGFEVFFSKIFSNWFLEDPQALSKWVAAWRARSESRPPDTFAQGFANEAARWAALARAVEDPAAGAREFARFAKQTTVSYYTGLAELGQKLETTEQRLAFLQTLHTATEGKVNINAFVVSAAKQSSFAQISSLLDQLPVFDSAMATPALLKSGKPATVRCLAASNSTDGTPKERWDWLVTCPEDTPEGTALKTLVENWAKHDDAATAEWIATLAPGPTRVAVEKLFAKWRLSNTR